MAITAKLVSELREKTGAGMMDCKKALEATGGDFEQAIDYLRKKGAAVAAKRAEKTTSEGLIVAKVSENSKSAAIVELNCETDFVAKSDDFVKVINLLNHHILNNNYHNLDDLLNSKLDNLTVKEHVDELMGKVGEKILLSRFAKLEVTNGIIVDYIHPGSKLAVLALFEATTDINNEFKNIGKDICMQIAAMRPLAISREGIDKAVLDKEIEIYKEQAKTEGKPEAIAEKIAHGRLEKFYKENCLLEQDFVKDATKVVGALIKEYNEKNKTDIKMTKFLRFHIGDEKK